MLILPSSRRVRDRGRESEPAQERNVKLLIMTEMRKRGTREEMHTLPLMRAK